MCRVYSSATVPDCTLIDANVLKTSSVLFVCFSSFTVRLIASSLFPSEGADFRGKRLWVDQFLQCPPGAGQIVNPCLLIYSLLIGH